MKCNLEIMQKEIAVMLPSAHEDGGEATLLITDKGEKYLDRRSTGWILKRLAHFHKIDLRAVKKNLGPLLGRKRYIPLSLSPKLIYLPFTFKTNTLPADQRLGYVSLDQVAGIKEGKKENSIILKSGLELLCCNTLRTMENRLREGSIAQKLLLSEYREDSACGEGCVLYTAGKNLQKDKTTPFKAAFFYY